MNKQHISASSTSVLAAGVVSIIDTNCRRVWKGRNEPQTKVLHFHFIRFILSNLWSKQSTKNIETGASVLYTYNSLM